MMNRRLSHAILLILLAMPLMLALPSCDSKPDAPGITNPLDPDHPDTGGDGLAPAAEYDSTGFVTVSWNANASAALSDVVIYRRPGTSGTFAVLDTVPIENGSQQDDSPFFFAMSQYRVAGLSAAGTMTDTTGRPVLTIDAPPSVAFGDRTGIAKTRRFLIAYQAGDADSVRFVVNGTLAGAPWMPVTGSILHELPATHDTTVFSLQFRRDDGGAGVLSDSIGRSVRPVRTRGAITVAGGEPRIARRDVAVSLTGAFVKQIILSENEVFGDAGDSVITLDTLVSATEAAFTWRFEAAPGTRILRAQFASDFLIDTVAADTVIADDLTDVSIALSNSDTTFDCANPVTLSAVATQMNLKKGFPADGWEPFREDAVWVIEDTTAGVKIAEVLFANDFVNPAPVPARDTTVFTLRPFGATVDVPEDATEFAPGDSVGIRGSVIAASCAEAPDSVSVYLDDTLIERPAASPTWTTFVFLDSEFEDTTEVTIRVEAMDDAGATASDTVRVTVIP
ncbi:MAG: hypothetical protein HKN20_09380 [Gemmatimonadetes bacterium]|nr:hypothetical protein [Gemmatimonadota bacterium]